MTAREARETTDIPLPADLSIGRAVRGAVRDQLDRWGLSDEVAYRTMIVATELASNALLHAAPPFVLRLSATGEAVRIGVGDALALSPTVRQYDELAFTGRGLRLVADYCSRWGVEGRDGGKEVWAEVPFVSDGGPPAPMQTTERSSSDDGAPADSIVRFLAVPVATYFALQKWNDAVVRECELIAGLQPVPGHLPPRLLELAVRLTGRFAVEREGFRDAMAAARVEGARTADLEESWPPPNQPDVASANAFVAMMEELDGFCRANVLLAEPPDPAVVDLRRWFVTEMEAQLLGHAEPVPFDRP